MFKVTWTNYGELDFRSTDFCGIVYDISNHSIFYETCNDIRHNLRCDFGSIFDKIHSIVSSDEFQTEKPYEDGCDGSWYKFEYTMNGKEVQYEGYIYGLKCHEEVISLIKSCAKGILEDERKLLEHRCTDNEMHDIIESRKRLEDDFSDCWKGILSEIQLPNGFIKCDNCNSIIHNKYYKNRKYWGRVWLSGEFGDYEVEYDSGECPVCGQLNTELPYTGLEFQPDEDLLENNNKAFTIEPDENSNKLYTFDELNDLLKHISDEDKIKIISCQFKLFETRPYDDSGDIYYDLKVYKDSNEIGKINMYYHSNTYFDLIDKEIKTTDDTPYYTYEMILYEDSKGAFSNKDIGDPFNDLKDGFDIQDTWNPFEDFKDIGDPFNDLKDGFGIQDIGNYFDDSKFRCKKCGKVFCSCNTSFSRRD